MGGSREEGGFGAVHLEDGTGATLHHAAPGDSPEFDSKVSPGPQLGPAPIVAIPAQRMLRRETF